MATTTPVNVLVIGGTGAQGQAVVPELVKDGKYFITILTRNPTNPIAKSLKAWGNVRLLAGSYDKEADLRKALEGQHAVYSNHNSFTMTEGEEYFWTFRLYDLAVQYDVKHFIYSSVPNWPKVRNYAEEYRASHALVMGRIAEWLSVQPTSLMGWTTLVGTYYTEMLSDSLSPYYSAKEGTYIFPGLTGDAPAPHFVDLKQYGVFTRWVLDNPERSIGKEIYLGRYSATLKEIAEAFERVTGKKARPEHVTLDQWFALEAVRKGFDVDKKRPLNKPGGEDDDSRFTFRQIFSALWNIGRSLGPDDIEKVPGQELMDEIYPDRIKSVEEWMRVTNYTGEGASPLKMFHDRKSKNN